MLRADLNSRSGAEMLFIFFLFNSEMTSVQQSKIPALAGPPQGLCDST